MDSWFEKYVSPLVAIASVLLLGPALVGGILMLLPGLIAFKIIEYLKEHG